MGHGTWGTLGRWGEGQGLLTDSETTDDPLS